MLAKALQFVFLMALVSKVWAVPKNPTPREDPVLAVVEKMSGNAFVKRALDNYDEPIALGTRIYQNDLLKTRNRGRLHVHLKQGTYVEFAKDTQAAIEKISLEPHKQDSVIRLNKGGLGLTVVVDTTGVAPLFFLVKTSLGVLQVVEASEFVVLQPEENRTVRVLVKRGKVLLVNAFTNNKVEVSAGFEGEILVSGSARLVKRFSEDVYATIKQTMAL